MAATVGGAIRGLIVGSGLVNQRCWADQAPTGATTPYVTIIDSITTLPQLTGDQATLALSRLSQVDLWQKGDGEDYDLPPALHALLDGARLTVRDTTTTVCRVENVQRFFERDTYIVHHAFTLNVRHDPSVL